MPTEIGLKELDTSYGVNSKQKLASYILLLKMIYRSGSSQI